MDFVNNDNVNEIVSAGLVIDMNVKLVRLADVSLPLVIFSIPMNRGLEFRLAKRHHFPKRPRRTECLS